jgi:hypothetical protein
MDQSAPIRNLPASVNSTKMTNENTRRQKPDQKYRMTEHHVCLSQKYLLFGAARPVVAICGGRQLGDAIDGAIARLQQEGSQDPDHWLAKVCHGRANHYIGGAMIHRRLKLGILMRPNYSLECSK